MTSEKKKEGFTWLYRGCTLIMLPWTLNLCYGIYNRFEDVQKQVAIHAQRIDTMEKRLAANEYNDKAEHSLLFREIKDEKKERESFNEKYIWNNPYFKIR